MVLFHYYVFVFTVQVLDGYVGLIVVELGYGFQGYLDLVDLLVTVVF